MFLFLAVVLQEIDCLIICEDVPLPPLLDSIAVARNGKGFRLFVVIKLFRDFSLFSGMLWSGMPSVNFILVLLSSSLADSVDVWGCYSCQSVHSL